MESFWAAIKTNPPWEMLIWTIQPYEDYEANYGYNFIMGPIHIAQRPEQGLLDAGRKMGCDDTLQCQNAGIG